ncbi:MAG: fasciclin domain-containing protein [Alphaproteobacteria bacterium]|nr:fasciclin domain-containing protein [Alphaproteobacteria bacterium]
MHHLAIKAAAAALVVGAGTGAVTKSDNGTATDIPHDALNPMVAGQAMLSGASIYDNISRSPEHTAFVEVAMAAGVGNTLRNGGQYTVFAPTNAAYNALSRDAATDARHAARYLVVRGQLDSQALLGMINANGGEAKLKTLDGHTVTAMLNGPTNIALMDERGRVADISIYDIHQRNGVLQVIDAVLLPGKQARS